MRVTSRRRPLWLVPAAIAAGAALVLHAAGRPWICLCGHVRAFAPDVHSAENSQQLADWYSPSHLIHGLLFYGALRWLLPRAPLVVRATLATLVEAGWEIVENSPAVIARYRAATMAAGYVGDSVLNSMSDIACMLIGFALARLLPVRVAILLGLGLELLTLVLIRDNLTLNILMLVHPIDAIRVWQAGA